MTHHPDCWIAAHGIHERGDMPPCEGPLVRCHLIPRQELRRIWNTYHHGIRRSEERRDLPTSTLTDLMWHPATWVWGCGGIMGNAGHHAMLDHSRTIRIPRSAIPPETVAFAQGLDLEWFLERYYR
jgi:hypothetical protein